MYKGVAHMEYMNDFREVFAAYLIINHIKANRK